MLPNCPERLRVHFVAGMSCNSHTPLLLWVFKLPMTAAIAWKLVPAIVFNPLDDKFNFLLSQKACLNPTFDGSGFIEGADTDLVVDGCLIDIKTTINPLKDAQWIYQVLGYVLLDWHDENQIKDVAIYFSRQSFMLKWSLNDLLTELMNEPKSLSELRELWYELIGANYFGKDDADPFVTLRTG